MTPSEFREQLQRLRQRARLARMAWEQNRRHGTEIERHYADQAVIDFIQQHQDLEA